MELFYDVVDLIESYHFTLRTTGPVVFAVGVLVYIFARTRKRMKLRHMRVTGRHKKYDIDPLFDA